MKRRTDKSIIEEAVSALDSSPDLLKNDAIIDWVWETYQRPLSKQQVQKYCGRYIERCQKHYDKNATKTADKLLDQCNGNLEVTQQIINKVYYTKER